MSRVYHTLISIILCASAITCKGDCVHGSVRLVNGPDSNAGRLELCLYTIWGTVADWNFFAEEAVVVCRMLGYNVDPSSGSSSSLHNAAYGQGSGPVWMLGPECVGSEETLLNCQTSFTYSTTSHSDDVGVSCQKHECIDGSTRLVGGLVDNEGTVEICQSGAWNSVCSSHWGYQETFVICRQLGLPVTEIQWYRNARFGEGHGTPTLYNWRCFGNESSLVDCLPETYSMCYHINDVGVSCNGQKLEGTCFSFTMRLVDLDDSSTEKTEEGRVEYCSNQVWGTVSYDTGFGVNDAMVVCRRLGIQSPRVQLFNSSYYGQGRGPIVYNGLNCVGTESNLESCSITAVPYFITHDYDVGIRCYEKDATINCNYGEVSLTGGSNNDEGRLEVCLGNQWGTVLDENFTRNDGQVICRQLGYNPPYATVYKDSYFGDGDQSVLVNRLDCSGTENNITECRLDTSNVEAFYGNTVGVRCYTTSDCGDGDVRLVGGETAMEGDVQVCQNGTWGFICAENNLWTLQEAQTVCQQLAYLSSGYFISLVSFFSSHKDSLTAPIVADGYNCPTDAETLFNCTQYAYGTQSPRCINVAGVICQANDYCNNGSVRIVDGDQGSEGRVELCSEGVWTTILDESWGYEDAVVVCRQLEFHDRWAVPISEPYISAGHKRPYFSRVACNGSEPEVINCSHGTVESSEHIENWYHSKRAGVSCETRSEVRCLNSGSVRLVGGANEQEGRVEVCMGGYWGTVCSDGWSEEDALVVCRQAGYDTLKPVPLHDSAFGRGFGPVHMTSVSCGGSEGGITECKYQPGVGVTNCHHGRDAGAICTGGIPEYYSIEVTTTPAEGPFAIGSEVTLHCRISPYLQHGITYQWTTSNAGVNITHQDSSSPNATFTIPIGHAKYGYYYCHVRGNDSALASGFAVLEIQDLLAMNESNTLVQQDPGSNIILEIIKTSAVTTTEKLRELSWYHGDSNQSLVADKHKYELKNDNMTLMIKNFSSADAGTYTARYNGLLLYPHDRFCEQQVLRALERYPVLRPFMITLAVDGSATSDSTAPHPLLESSTYISSFASGGDVSFAITANTLSQDNFLVEEYKDGAPLPLKRREKFELVSPPQLYIEYEIASPNLFDSGLYEFQLQNDYTLLLSKCPSSYISFIQESMQLNISSVIVESLLHKVSRHEPPELELKASEWNLTPSEDSTVSCLASGGYPQYHNLSLVKNDRIIASGIAHEISISTSEMPVTKYGVYRCMVNNSIAVTEVDAIMKERASLVLTFDTSICGRYEVGDFLQPVVLLLAMYCSCSLDQSSLVNSSLSCFLGELQFQTKFLYSSDDGSVTASTVIAITEYQLDEQANPVLTVNGEDLEIITSREPCSVDLLTGLFFAGVGSTLVIFVASGIAICFVCYSLRRRRRRKYNTRGTERTKNATSQSDTVHYSIIQKKGKTTSSDGKKAEQVKDSEKGAVQSSTKDPAPASNPAKLSKPAQAAKATEASKAPRSPKPSGAAKDGQPSKTTSKSKPTSTTKPKSTPKTPSSSKNTSVPNHSPAKSVSLAIEVHDELEIGSDEELYDDIVAPTDDSDYM